jgi:hypothetical protein
MKGQVLGDAGPPTFLQWPHFADKPRLPRRPHTLLLVISAFHSIPFPFHFSPKSTPFPEAPASFFPQGLPATHATLPTWTQWQVKVSPPPGPELRRHWPPCWHGWDSQGDRTV